MELKKSKYTQKEVLDILNAYKGEYEKRLNEQRELIAKLNKEIRELNAVADSVKEKEQLLLSALMRAEKSSADLVAKAKEQYDLEVERLKKFAVRWNAYFKALREKYPLYPPTQMALEMQESVENIEEGSESKDVIDRLDKSLDESASAGEKFDPKSKIRDYIAATGDNGFNLDEVLNPGKLKLEDLCRELGLIDSNE